MVSGEGIGGGGDGGTGVAFFEVFVACERARVRVEGIGLLEAEQRGGEGAEGGEGEAVGFERGEGEAGRHDEWTRAMWRRIGVGRI